MIESRQFPSIGKPVYKHVLLDFPTTTKELDLDAPLRFVASTEAVDRYGDVVRADKWELNAFKSNPMVLFGHSHTSPVGTATRVWTEAKQLLSDVKLAAAGTSALIDSVRSLVQQRILRAVSVGFLPTVEPKYLRDAESKAVTGYEFVGQELLEISLVAVPANPEALSVVRSFNLSDEDQRRLFLPANRGHSAQRARAELEKLRVCG